MWSKSVRTSVEWSLTGGQPYGPDKTFIDTALSYVKADLETSERVPDRQGQPGEPLAGGMTPVEGVDKAAETGRKRLFGDTWDVFGGTFYWRNVRPWFCGLSIRKKLIAAVLGILLLAFCTRSLWLPLVHHYIGRDTAEEGQMDS